MRCVSNRVGKVRCVCKTNYKMIIENGRIVCVEDPCAFIECGDFEKCVVENKVAKCVEKDPCDSVRCGFHQKCISTDGNPDCVCRDGFIEDVRGGCVNSTKGIKGIT